jgi:HK97 family phage major capsid protein
MWQQIKSLTEQRGQLLTEMRSILKKSESERRDLTPDECGKFDDLNVRVEGLKSKIERIERAYGGEQRNEGQFNPRGPIAGANPARHGDGAEMRNAQDALIDMWARNGTTLMSSEQRSEYDRALAAITEEQRATITTSGSSSMMPVYVSNIETADKYTGAVRELATYQSTPDCADIKIPLVNDLSNTGELTAEGSDVTEDVDPTVSTAVTLKAYTIDSGISKISVQLAMVAPSFGTELAVQQFNRIERKANALFTTGTGTGEPQGVSTGATVGKTAAGAAAITYDELLDLYHSVDPFYRKSSRAAFMLNDLTLAAIRKLKDTAGRYIWMPGEAGDPGTILGTKYVVNPDMANMGAGNRSVLFGDFSKYRVREAGPMVLSRLDQLYAKKLLIGYLAYRMLDGKLVDAGGHPIKCIVHP